MNKVKMYNWLWYRIVRYLIPLLPKKMENIERKSWRMSAQFSLAKIFGGVHGVIFGDSNGAVLDEYKTMSKFDRIVINISVPGSTAHDWYYFFIGVRGRKIRLKTYKVKQIINLGGNYILLGKMNKAREGMKWLRSWFPDSYICTIPPINDVMLAKLAKAIGLKGPIDTPEYFREGVLEINKYAREFWKEKCIDLYKFFGGKDGKVKPGTLKDFVHFSDMAVTMIQTIFDAVI